MKINYDRETDSLYIDLSPKPSVESEEVADNFVIDFGANGEPVGIDIQHASKMLDIAELITHNMPANKVAVARPPVSPGQG